MQKVKTNRKATPGRCIYYQHIIDKNTGERKTIKHIQPTVNEVLVARIRMEQSLRRQVTSQNK